MNNEAIGSDVGRVGFTAPISAIGDMKPIEPHNNYWRFSVEWFGECDHAAGQGLGFIRGVIVYSTKRAELEIAIVRVDLEPCAPSGVKDSVFRCVEMDLDRVLRDGLNEGIDADIGTFIDVEPCEAYREDSRACGYANDFFIRQLGLIGGVKINGIEGIVELWRIGARCP